MNGIKFFPKNLEIEDKRVLLRLDLNVPLKDGKILDKTRISLAVPFLKELVKKKSKIILISHLGRPKGKKNKKLSLAPIFEYLKKKIDTKIFFYDGEINDEAEDKSKKLKKGEILFLENIRFFKEEEENDERFSKKLSQLGDIYINDAFSCSHRKQSSIHKIVNFFKASYGGPLLKKEIGAIDLVIKEKQSPVTCIIGGSKISTKINVLLNLIKNVDNVIIVGAMANSFLYHKGNNIGKSLFEENSNNIIEEIYSKSKKNKCKIVLPIDCLVSKNFEGKAEVRAKDKINIDEIILDIGPKTIELIIKIIDESKTVLWNGPAGYYENENFSIGTKTIANKISKNTCNNSLISILGGGDTIAALNKSNLKLSFTHLSTAGGAFLEYLEGKDLPGLTVLK